MSALTKATFSDLVARNEKLVYTACYQLTRDRMASEDLTQDTFLTAYLHLGDCPADYERPWLLRIASNKAKDYLQSAYVRHAVLPGDESMPPGLPEPSSEDLAICHHELSDITALIHELREPYRSVCFLVLLQEKTPEETALELGRPVKTIHTQISRAKIMLRQQLERRKNHGSLSDGRTPD